MADTVSWTEPLGSTGERLYLGIECDCGCGEVRGVACMGGAGCENHLIWRVSLRLAKFAFKFIGLKMQCEFRS